MSGKKVCGTLNISWANLKEF